MRRISITLLSCSALLFVAVSCNKAPENNQNSENMKTTDNTLFSQGEKASADYFTGAAWIQPLVNPTDVENLYTIGSVTFESGARTKWHTHPAGQVLIVTEGRGWYQEKGKSAQELTKGSVIAIPKDVEHWHGAAADSRFVHIAITNFKENNNVTWMSSVTDEEYNSIK